jgi:palmitoyltransferase
VGQDSQYSVTRVRVRIRTRRDCHVHLRETSHTTIQQHATHMDTPILQKLALPFGTVLVSFLSFASQWLFHHIEPGPLRKGDAYIFNALVACTLICFWRTCLTDPGRIPKNWQEYVDQDEPLGSNDQTSQRQRWCRKCEAYKPPRAHHCKTCKRLVSRAHVCPYESEFIQVHYEDGPPLRLDR